MRFCKNFGCGVIVALCAGFASVAMADGITDALKTCRTIADVGARAACYDHITDTLPIAKAPTVAAPSASNTTAPRTAAPVVPVVPPVAATPEQRFGEKDLPIKKRVPEEEQAPDELVLKVVGVRTDQTGYATFTLENGQVWRQVESSSLKILNGARVKVRSGTLGVFYMSLENANKSFRVKRVN
jgi:hypothetical protein